MEVFQEKKSKTGIISWLVFLVTIPFVVISTIPAVFPALLLRTFGGLPDYAGVDAFEIGAWAVPLLITNAVFFGLGILYWKNKIPGLMSKALKRLYNFEVSPQIAFIAIVIITGIYVVFTVDEVLHGQYQADYYERVRSRIDNFTPTEVGIWGIGGHLHVALLVLSEEIFGLDKVIPFMASAALPIMTYLVTAKMTERRFAGLIAMVIVLQSFVFLTYDTSVSYPNFWILFFMGALYLVYKFPIVSPVSFVMGVLTKVLAGIFYPMIIFFIYRANIERKKKIRSLIFYTVLFAASLIALNVTNSFSQFSLTSLYYDNHDFWGGFSGTYISLMHDGLVFAFLIPLTVALFVASKKGVKQGDTLLIFILFMVLSMVVVPAVSAAINVPYRIIPLVVFFAMGVGILFSRLPSSQFLERAKMPE